MRMRFVATILATALAAVLALPPAVPAGAAELVDPDLERHARPRRRLLEDHPECPAGEELVRLSPLPGGFQLVCEVEHRLQLLGGPASDSREVAPLQVVGDVDHSAQGC